MRFNRDIHHRRSIRLRGYDYSQAGLYFITLCTYERLALFGNVTAGTMQLNDMGYIARNEWERIAEMRPDVSLGEFVVMPNHLHGIIAITASISSVISVGAHGEKGRVQRAPTVGDIVRGYKSTVTKRVRQLNNHADAPVWQRNYYEHIVRNEAAHLKITEYIRDNPAQWQDDTYYIS